MNKIFIHDLRVEARIGVYDWEITYNCTPGSPWTVGVVGSTNSIRVRVVE